MGLSKNHLSSNREAVCFEPERLGLLLQQRVPEAVFCLLMGSAAGGVVAPGSDLDLAFFLRSKPTLDFFQRVAGATAEMLPEVRCDAGILNSAEPVYRFEALKGRLLFVHDRVGYAAFYSLTCREYESQMASYERQRLYRQEARHAV